MGSIWNKRARSDTKRICSMNSVRLYYGITLELGENQYEIYLVLKRYTRFGANSFIVLLGKQYLGTLNFDKNFFKNEYSYENQP